MSYVERTLSCCDSHNEDIHIRFRWTRVFLWLTALAASQSLWVNALQGCRVRDPKETNTLPDVCALDVVGRLNWPTCIINLSYSFVSHMVFITIPLYRRQELMFCWKWRFSEFNNTKCTHVQQLHLYCSAGMRSTVSFKHEFDLLSFESVH